MSPEGVSLLHPAGWQTLSAGERLSCDKRYKAFVEISFHF
jgi:hypothetical protein